LGLVLARRILALALILAGAALLSRRLRSAGLALPPARCRLLLSAAALRGGPATALRATAGKSPARGSAATGGAGAAAPTSPSLRIRLANDDQHENTRNECGPDTTP
jgi:hypothetical protein